ncbi:hypothetical protein TNCV_2541981 [Trichonephila clavipes]|nr:hypothetical protein TNCV_2541981 [Trichonephila clavipes]
MRWAGHIVRMSPERTALKIFNEIPSNKRRLKVRPKKRWKDCVDEDFVTLKVKNWISIVRRRAEWKKILRKSQAPTKGCHSNADDNSACAAWEHSKYSSNHKSSLEVGGRGKERGIFTPQGILLQNLG